MNGQLVSVNWGLCRKYLQRAERGHHIYMLKLLEAVIALWLNMFSGILIFTNEWW